MQPAAQPERRRQAQVCPDDAVDTLSCNSLYGSRRHGALRSAFRASYPREISTWIYDLESRLQPDPPDPKGGFAQARLRNTVNQAGNRYELACLLTAALAVG